MRNAFLTGEIPVRSVVCGDESEVWGGGSTATGTGPWPTGSGEADPGEAVSGGSAERHVTGKRHDGGHNQEPGQQSESDEEVRVRVNDREKLFKSIPHIRKTRRLNHNTLYRITLQIFYNWNPFIKKLLNLKKISSIYKSVLTSKPVFYRSECCLTSCDK